MAASPAITVPALIVHILAAVVWVGGMFFAHQVLRPAAVELDPEARLPLWLRVFERFFSWVFAAIVLLLASGYGLVFAIYGGFQRLPIFVNVMQGVGIAMMLLFLHLYFAPWRRFRIAVARRDWNEAARQLGQIRLIVTINLALGLIVIAIGGSGPYWS